MLGSLLGSMSSHLEGGSDQGSSPSNSRVQSPTARSSSPLKTAHVFSPTVRSQGRGPPRHPLEGGTEDVLTSGMLAVTAATRFKRAPLGGASNVHKVIGDFKGNIDDVAGSFLKRKKANDVNVTALVEVMKMGDSKLLSLLNEAELQQIAMNSAVRRVTENQLIMSQGETSSSMYIVLSGFFDVLVDFSGSKSVAEAEKVDVAEVGAVLGEIGMMTGDRRNAFVRANGMCEVIEVQFETIKNVETKRPEVASQLSALVRSQKNDLLMRRRDAKKKAEENMLSKVDSEVDKLEMAKVKAQKAKKMMFQNRIMRAVELNKESEMHDAMETLRLQLLESVKSAFAVAWPMIDLKHDTNQKIHLDLVELLEEHPGVADSVHAQLGQTLLQKASGLGAVRLCATLLRCRASPDTRDIKGNTSLHNAVQAANTRLRPKGLLTIRILLAAGATHSRNFHGQSPLELCQRDDVRLVLHENLYDEQLSRCAMSACLSGKVSIICRTCKLVKYCCIEHQRRHLEEHRGICRAPMSASETAPAHAPPLHDEDAATRSEADEGEPTPLASTTHELLPAPPPAPPPAAQRSADLASFRYGKWGAVAPRKIISTGKLSERAFDAVDDLHEKLNNKIMGRNWQVYEKGLLCEASHRTWVLRAWIHSWVRFVWIERAILAIDFRSETKGLKTSAELADAIEARHPTGAKKAGALPPSPQKAGREDGRAKKSKGYEGGGWEEVSDSSKKPPNSVTMVKGRSPDVKWGVSTTPRLPNAATPRKLDPLAPPKTFAVLGLPTESSPGAKSPQKTVDGGKLLKMGHLSPGKSGMARLKQVIGAQVRDKMLTEMFCGLRDKPRMIGGVGGDGEKEEKGNDGSAHDVGKIIPEDSHEWDTSGVLSKPKKKPVPIDVDDGGVVTSEALSSTETQTPEGSHPSTSKRRLSVAMGMWDGILGGGKKEEEPSRILNTPPPTKMRGQGRKIVNALGVMERLSDISQRCSIINIDSQEDSEKRDITSVVLDHIKHLDEQTKGIILERIGLHAEGDAEGDIEKVMSMSTEEFERYVAKREICGGLQQPNQEEVVHEKTVEQIQELVLKGEMQLQELELETLKELCNIGFNIAKRKKRPPRDRRGSLLHGSYALTPSLRASSLYVHEVITRANKSHLVDPFGSHLELIDTDGQMLPADGLLRRFKGVHFQTFKEKYSLHGDEDSD